MAHCTLLSPTGVQTLEFGFCAVAADRPGVDLRYQQAEQDSGDYFLQV